MKATMKTLIGVAALLFLAQPAEAQAGDKERQARKDGEGLPHANLGCVSSVAQVVLEEGVREGPRGQKPGPNRAELAQRS